MKLGLRRTVQERIPLRTAGGGQPDRRLEPRDPDAERLFPATRRSTAGGLLARPRDSRVKSPPVTPWSLVVAWPFDLSPRTHQRGEALRFVHVSGLTPAPVRSRELLQ
jgi:hypothetical protein